MHPSFSTASSAAPGEREDVAANILAKSSQEAMLALAVEASKGSPDLEIALLYANPDFKAGADRMLEELFSGVPTVESTSVQTITDEVARNARKIFFVLAECGVENPIGLHLATKIGVLKEEGKIDKFPSFVLGRRSPGPGGTNIDGLVERLIEQNEIGAVIDTPFRVPNMRLAVAEALLRSSGKLEAVNILARKEVINRMTDMISVLTTAWQQLLSHKFENREGKPLTSIDTDPEGSELVELLAKVEKANLELMSMNSAGTPERERISKPLRDLRIAIESTLEQISVVNSQVSQKAIPATPRHVSALEEMEVQATQLLAVFQLMRSAYRDHFGASWYRVLKMIEEPEFFVNLKRYYERVSAMQNFLKFVSEEALEQASKVDATISGAMQGREIYDDILKFWRELQDGLISLAGQAAELQGMAIYINEQEVSHYMVNKTNPLSSSCTVAEDYGALEPFNEREQASLKEAIAKVEVIAEILGQVLEAMRSGNTRGLREKIIAKIIAERSR